MKRTEAFNEILGTEISGVWFDEVNQCTVHSTCEPFNIGRSTSGSMRHEAQSRKQRRAVQIKQLRMKLHID